MWTVLGTMMKAQVSNSGKEQSFFPGALSSQYGCLSTTTLETESNGEGHWSDMSRSDRPQLPGLLLK